MTGAILYALILFASQAAEDGAKPPTLVSSKSCSNKILLSPLKGSARVSSAFDPSNDHYGVDFATNNEPVVAVGSGIIQTIGWNARPLTAPNPRSGLKVRGWGRYIVIHHDDGAESLYAHLDPESTNTIKVGQKVQAGDAIGRSDTSGGAKGAHLHFEYAPHGSISSNHNKTDGYACIARRGWLTLESWLQDANGIGQLFIDGKLIGENLLHQKTRFEIQLKPGRYEIRVIAKTVQRYKAAYFSLKMGEPFTILEDDGAETGPGMAEELQQGEEMKAILSVD